MIKVVWQKCILTHSHVNLQTNYTVGGIARLG